MQNTDKKIYTLPATDLKFDPLEIHRKLILETRGELAEHIKNYNDGETEFVRAAAEEVLVAATRKVFGLLSVTEVGGFGDVDSLAFLSHYLGWLSTPSDSLPNPKPISRPCTGCPPPKTT